METGTTPRSKIHTRALPKLQIFILTPLKWPSSSIRPS
jgi:hypothetical protein